MSKKTHLTDADRLQIEILLKQRCPLSKIAEQVGKSKSTISREIQKRARESEKFAASYPHNRCAKRKGCQRIQLCEDKPNCSRQCSLCGRCNKICPQFEEEVCLKLFEPPYVCNGCPVESRCPLKKRYYLHKQAHEAYREMLSESRQGANITEEELLDLDGFVSPLIKNGQSVSHIFRSNLDRLCISESSVYRYISGGLLKADNLDMPRVVRFKPRKLKPVEHMMSHINSYSREKLNNKSPLAMFNFLYGEGLAQKLGQIHIPANDIMLKPSLLKK